LTWKNIKAAKSLTLTHINHKYVDAQTTNYTTITERTGWGGGGGKARDDDNKGGQASSLLKTNEPLPTKKQNDKSKNNKEGEGGGQSKRRRRDDHDNASHGVGKEDAKLDTENDEASGEDDNADFMDSWMPTTKSPPKTCDHTYSRVPGDRNHCFGLSQRVSKHTLMKSETQPASVVSINH